MTDSTTWMERVAAWQASGLSARAFAKGKGYTAGALYYWQRRAGDGVQSAGPGFSFARVVREKATRASGGVPGIEPGSTVPLVLEFCGARLILRPGFDRPSLATILDVLEERAQVAP